MKGRLFFLMSALFIGSAAFGQSENFENVFKGCALASSSVNSKGSSSEMTAAYDLLKSTEWSFLKLQDEDVEGEADIGKGNMVFTVEYLHQYITDPRKVYQKAREYTKEKESMCTRRGADVQLCTKCIAGCKKVTYYIRNDSKPINVAAVAEVNGLINLYVVVEDEKGNKSNPYKVTSDESKGAAYRRLCGIKMPKGNDNVVYITVENKVDIPKSVAIIVE